MPSFCRHNRLIQNCPICAREQAIEPRAVVSSSAPRTSQPREPRTSGQRTPGASTGRRSARARPAAGDGLTVRRLTRGADDGYRTALAPGLKSSVEAQRLAEELAFAAGRLTQLTHDPPGLYGEVADERVDLEERTWLAFLIAYLGPLETDEPFRAVREVRTTWASGSQPSLEQIETGPRSGFDPARDGRTLDAYRSWANRARSQAAAFTGDPSWSAERRFSRIYERLALPGLERDTRFDLLVTLGRLELYELRPDSLQLGGTNEVTVAAKRVLGIGETLLLERRARALAEGCAVPLEALDLGFYNWGRGERATGGLGRGAAPDPAALQSVQVALEL